MNPDDPIVYCAKPPWWRAHWVPVPAGAVAGVLFGLVVLWTSTPKPPPPPPPQTVVFQEIFGCQFMVFSNPFFILHFPRCAAHGAHATPVPPPPAVPVPVERPANMPAP